MNLALCRVFAVFSVLLAHAGCRSASNAPTADGRANNSDVVVASSARKETDAVMDTLFETAVKSSGPAYMAAERALRDAGPSAVPVLRKNLNNPDPIARLVARTILDWQEGSAKDYQAVLDYLDGLPARLAPTPITSPSPTGIAGYLSIHFGASAVDFLSVQLVKGSDWPRWRVLGVIFYLKEQARSSSTEALLRFAAETKQDSWVGYAIEAIVAANDPDLKSKIAAERQRQSALGRQLPAAIEALTTPGH